MTSWHTANLSYVSLPRDATLSPPNVVPQCPFVTFSVQVCVVHTCWNTSKIISRLISLWFWFTLTPASVIWSN